ncbi:MAG: alkyl hydroperoxide reductase [Chloroflexi bacterium]|nr:alkyl hydroperoxide reductase [Chloroflexota bacterium]
MNCHHNVAQLRRLREQFPDTLVTLGVHSAKFPTEKLTTSIREAVMRHEMSWPVINDAGFQVWNSYAVRAWPTVVLVDPAGRVVETTPGEISAEDFIPTIQTLIDQAEQNGTLQREPITFAPEEEAEPTRPLKYPAKVLAAAEDRLFVADTGHNRILELKLDAEKQTGEIVRVIGSGQRGLQDGPIASTQFHGPHGMALVGDVLYVADTENHAIRAVDLANQTVRTVAGTGEKGGYRLDLDQPPTQIELRSPWDVYAEGDIIFIAMAGSHMIWVMLDEKQLGPFAGNGREALVDGPRGEASFNQPSAIDFGMGHLFVADSEASAIRAISFDEESQVMTLIGRGLFEFGDIDGVGGEVRLQHPTGVAVQGSTVYIADTYNNKIKTLDPTKALVETLIGSGESGHADGAFAAAQVYEPEGLDVQGETLFIADTNNHLIRVADLSTQTVHTLTLTGLDKLMPAIPALEREPDHRLEAISVQAGDLSITLHLSLPAGTKLNPDAPLTVRQNGSVHQFQAGDDLRFTAQIDAAQDLDLDIVVYYCEAEDARLCMIHDTRLRLPIQVGGEAQTVTVPLAVE